MNIISYTALLLARRAVEFPLDISPAIDVVILKWRLFASKGCQVLGKAHLEYEGHSVFKFVRSKTGILCLFKCLAIRAIQKHYIVQADAA